MFFYSYSVSILISLFIFSIQISIVLFNYNANNQLKELIKFFYSLFSAIRGTKINTVEWWYVIFAAVIEMLNEVISRFYYKLTKRESHFTTKNKETSYAAKVIIGRFFLSEVTTFALFVLPRFFSKLKPVGGADAMGRYILTMLVINLTASPVLAFLKLDILTHNFGFFALNKNIKRQGKHFVNKQKTLDKMIKQDQQYYGNKYCDILKGMAVSCFYSWVLPIGPYISLATLLMQFWVDRKRLRRDSSSVELYGQQLSYVLCEYFKYIPLLYSAGNFAFPVIFGRGISGVDLAGFGISIFFCFFYSVRDLNRWLLFGDHKISWLKQK